MSDTPLFNLPYPADADPPDGPAQIQALAEAVEAALLPIGSIVATGRSTSAAPWLICDGSSVSRTTYADLYAAIGTTYGSADGSHFNLPDLRGRVPVGVDGGAARLTADDALGDSGGEEKHALTDGELDRATETISPPISGGASEYPFSIANDGSTDPHNTMQPYQVVNYLIRADTP